MRMRGHDEDTPQGEDVHCWSEAQSAVVGIGGEVIDKPLWGNVAGTSSRGVKEEGIICWVVLIEWGRGNER